MARVWKIGCWPGIGGKPTQMNKSRYIEVARARGFVAIGYARLGNLAGKSIEYFQDEGESLNTAKQLHVFANEITQGDVVLLYDNRRSPRAVYAGRVSAPPRGLSPGNPYYHVPTGHHLDYFRGKNNAPNRLNVKWLKLSGKITFPAELPWNDTVHRVEGTYLKTGKGMHQWFRDSTLKSFLRKEISQSSRKLEVAEAGAGQTVLIRMSVGQPHSPFKDSRAALQWLTKRMPKESYNFGEKKPQKVRIRDRAIFSFDGKIWGKVDRIHSISYSGSHIEDVRFGPFFQFNPPVKISYRMGEGGFRLPYLPSHQFGYYPASLLGRIEDFSKRSKGTFPAALTRVGGERGESGGPSGPTVQDLPHGGELEYEVRTRANIKTATKKEAELLRMYQGWLERKGRKLSLVRYRNLKCDAFEVSRRNLIEAKSSPKREYVRMAVGQLLDYSYQGREKFGKCNMAILLPGRPDRKSVQWISKLRISLIWRERGRFFDNADHQFV